MDLCQKPCRCVSDWHADFHCIVTVALVKRKQKTKISAIMQVFLYLSRDFYIPSAARWDVHKYFQKMPRFHSKPSLHLYLSILVRLVHWGSLSVAIAWVLWRKHGVSASLRLAVVSRWPNVWWPEAKRKNSLSGFDLYHESESLSNTFLPYSSLEDLQK